MQTKLKTLIKRDGSEQPYNFNKLKNWSRWACQDLSTVNWTKIVVDVLESISEEKISTQELQTKLINRTLSENTYEATIMAGRLFVALTRKAIFNSTKIPSVQAVYKRALAHGLAYDYLDKHMCEEQWAYVESIIDHGRDMDMTHGQIVQLQHKYALKDRKDKIIFESPQHTYMRIAMFVTKKRKGNDWQYWTKLIYDYLSLNRVSTPSPNFLNMGTNHNGLASCALLAAGDTYKSIAAAHVITSGMSAASAGIGAIYEIRSLDDKVRNGAITHGGKLPYHKTVGNLVLENITAGRNGAANVYYTAYDPEVISIMMAQNPMTPLSKQNRDLHTTMINNIFMVEKALLGEDVFTFNIFTRPALYDALFNKDIEVFRQEYKKAEEDPTFKKVYVSAREILISHFSQWLEVSTNYKINIDEINRHTPHKDRIRSANLCVEVTNPTAPYGCVEDLYKVDHDRGEVSICTLGAIVEYNIHSDAMYYNAAKVCLEIIDVCIDESDYAFPHIRYTAQMRRNAGVGMMGTAFSLAKEGLSITTKEGLNKVHQMAERHAYFLAKVALDMGKEKGNAPWMHKTKWPEGWLWIDTYNKNIDELVDVGYKYDWESLRKEIIANEGIRFSSLINFMPGESSSKATGSPNSIYLLRSLVKGKTDESNVLRWVAPQPKNDFAVYELAFNTSLLDQLNMYGVYQKFCDQSISADFHIDRSKSHVILEQDILFFYARMAKVGLKSAYYMVSETNADEDIGCASGGCTV